MILPRQKIYKFDFFLFIKSLINFDFFLSSDENQKKLEKKIAKFLSVKFCTVVPKGRVGLKILLNLLKQENSKKKDVIMSPFTIFDVVNMVSSENLKPKFIDINKKDFSISFINLKKKITKNTLALVLTHYHIEPLEYKKIVNYCRDKNIYLIEDRAIAFKKSFKKLVLNEKQFIFYSFSPFKFVSTIDLGVVVTNNLNYYKKIKQYKLKFSNKNYFTMFSRVFFMLKFYIASRNIFFFILFFLIKFSELFNISNFKNLLKNDPNPQKYLKKNKKNYFLVISNYQINSAINQITSKVETDRKERHMRAKTYSKKLCDIKKISFKNICTILKIVILVFQYYVKKGMIYIYI